MIALRIPTPLRSYTGGKNEVTVNGATIAEALDDLTTQFPAVKPHLFNEKGDLRPFINLFVGEHNIKDLQGADTPVKDGDKVMLIPSIAGGSTRHCEERSCSSRRSNLFITGDCFGRRNTALAMTESRL
ncbi:MAG: molybdopterin synthase sulfur carrier subunit [Chloroflexi bacterium]|nr:molybdopterin synthase sulfur carrier subunit [Chloroflexi bacterium CFX1]MCQ3952710.1 molybdopterin synthase sulfur carrier subunit [Chloroflexota bacterium]MDL1919213.1 MoaD/ThiS family protein [Chloroflexi bacterium CFX5]NUQ59265.1 MoaD/ThiS family protein [Anaerolineales bacterium]RIK52897.1 MAG: molybdopterin synthase sulfur carrier subunit [Chloroflexota bacterium]